MKKLVSLALSTLLTLSVYAGNYPDISIAELKAALTAGKVTLLDVNRPDSWREGHIPGALSFETSGSKLATLLPKDKSALIVAYCGGPQCRAYEAAAQAAKKLGYTNIKHLTAGIAGWRQAGEKTEPGNFVKAAAPFLSRVPPTPVARTLGRPESAWDKADSNRDGYLTRDEMKRFGSSEAHRDVARLLFQFDAADTNHDGIVTQAEIDAYGTAVGSMDPVVRAAGNVPKDPHNGPQSKTKGAPREAGGPRDDQGPPPKRDRD